MAAGFNVKLANTVAMKHYDGLKHSGVVAALLLTNPACPLGCSDDETDAAHLAHMLRLGILPTGYIHPPAERALRDLARKRIQLVRDRTRHVLAIEIILATDRRACFRHRDQALDGRRRGRLGADFGCRAGDEIQCCRYGHAQSGNRTHRGAFARRRETQARLRAAQEYPRHRRRARHHHHTRKGYAGIRKPLKRQRLRCTGDRRCRAFRASGKLRIVCALRFQHPTLQRQEKSEGNTKNGNAYLVWAFIEAANFARRYSEEAKTNTVVATKALAHKLARASYHMLKGGQPFDVKRCFV